MTAITNPSVGHAPQVKDFEITPELAAFCAQAREFAERELRSVAAELDAQAKFPREQVLRAGQLGLLGVTIPKRYGGSDRGNLASCLMLEEVNAVCPSTGVTLSVHNSLLCSPLAKWGTPQQQQAYFPRLVTGEWLGAYCLSEANSGSDAAALRCEAHRDGDDWVLNGAKLWITTGSEADLFIVFARTGADRVKGITAFLVERSQQGVGIGKKERKLGIRASPTVEVLLEKVRVPPHNLLGSEGNGFTIALDTLDGGRLGIASQALGITRACHDLLRDAGVRCSKEAAMAKLCASRLADRAAREVFELIGPAAAAGQSAVERLLRDARITEIYEGVTDIQRLVTARGVLGV